MSRRTACSTTTTPHAADNFMPDLSNHIRIRERHEPASQRDSPETITSPWSTTLVPEGGPYRTGTVLIVHRRNEHLCGFLDKMLERGFDLGLSRNVYHHVFVVREVDEEGRVLRVLDFDPIFDDSDGPLTWEICKRIVWDHKWCAARVLKGSQIDDMINGDPVEIHPTITPPEPGTAEHTAMVNRMQQAATVEVYRYSLWSFNCDGFANYIVRGRGIAVPRQACGQIRRLYISFVAAARAADRSASGLARLFLALCKRMVVSLWSGGFFSKLGAVALCIIVVLLVILVYIVILVVGTVVGTGVNVLSDDVDGDGPGPGLQISTSQSARQHGAGRRRRRRRRG